MSAKITPGDYTLADAKKMFAEYVRLKKYSGATWNDGGHWNKWIYKAPDAEEYWQVYMETDYRDDVTVSKVKPRAETTIHWDVVE